MMTNSAKVDFSHLEFNLKRLSSDVHSPCYVLHLRDVNVLLDCCIETSMLANFMPSHQLTSPGCSDLPPLQYGDVAGSFAEQVSVGNRVYLNSRPQFSIMNQEEFSSVIWDTIDVILVSNAQSILGLPFICESTNFRGRILTTEPVVKFGKILMEDILDALEQLPSMQPSFDLNRLDSKTKLNLACTRYIRLLTRCRLPSLDIAYFQCDFPLGVRLAFHFELITFPVYQYACIIQFLITTLLIRQVGTK
ncbi:hypothetical protein AHF37_11566 [Paragonimus kellicotti]|nr:hypothetical protein AHF37_11566 [Paragonimus kellicotti]